MMIFEKVLPKMKHHIAKSYRVSEGYYGGITDGLCGTGKGNSFSGATFRNISCIMFKNNENKCKGF